MNKIVHKVYITKKPRTPPIEVVYASSVPIRLELMDYTIPSGASAKVYANKRGSEDVYQASCTVDGNAVEFAPKAGFFAVGPNDLQLEINAVIIGHSLDVVCETRLKDKAGGSVTDAPETVESYAGRAEAAAAAAETYAAEASRASDWAYGNAADLAVKFATEIGSKDVWTWLKSRIRAGNFNGIFVGDYISVTCKNGNTFRAQVAGINTYKGCFGTILGNHIDFVSQELWPEAHAMNPVRWNNGFVSGAATSEFPWTASDLYLWLNSKAGTVPGDTAAPPGTAAASVDYTGGGVLGQLPDALAAVITDKSAYMPKRFNASEILTEDTVAANTTVGKLWIPTEMEVHGTAIYGCGGVGISGGIQYPIFRSKQNQVKYKAGTKTRAGWWLCSAAAGKTTHFCYVYSQGAASNTYANTDGILVPVCFRIAG